MPYPQAKVLLDNLCETDSFKRSLLGSLGTLDVPRVKERKVSCKQHREVTRLVQSQMLTIIIILPFWVSLCLYNEDYLHLTGEEILSNITKLMTEQVFKPRLFYMSVSKFNQTCGFSSTLLLQLNLSFFW